MVLETEQDYSKNAEIVYQSNTACGDYHKALDEAIYAMWIKNRFVPTFQEAFPSMKAIYISDNVSYHCLRATTYTLGASMLRKDAILWMEKFCVAEYSAVLGMEADAKGKKLSGKVKQWTTIDVCRLKQPQGGPYAEELAEYCHGVSQLHMAERGLDVNTTGLEEKFKEAGLDDWLVLFTPEYCSRFNPIEMYWAAVKRVAKTDWFDGRQFLERLVCIRQGFYGKDFKSPPNCYNLIRHSEDEMDAYMKEAGDSFLSGSSVRGEVKLTPAVLVDEAVSAYLAAMKPGATLDELKHALKLLKPSNKKLTIYTMTRMC